MRFTYIFELVIIIINFSCFFLLKKLKQTVIQYPQNDLAKSLRDNVFIETLESIEQIYSILKSTTTTTVHSEQIKSIKNTITSTPSLLSSLDDLDVDYY